jgi:hypothetical protein
LLQPDFVRDWTPALLALGLAACSVNPVPEPPAKPDTSGPIAADGCLQCDGAILLSGSATNADVIWAVNLDRQEPPSVADIAADGSFVVAIGATTGDELRIQARRDEVRSDPRDYLVPDQGDLVAVARPLFDCLPAPLELELGTVAIGAPPATSTIDLVNGCGDAVTLAAIGLRAPAPELVVSSSAPPVALADGASELVQIDFAPVLPGPREEILLVEITAPVPDRRAVTLLGRGTN